MAMTVTTSPYSLSFLRMALVFIAGGLFFSSAIACFTAGYAIGRNNVKRFSAMAQVVWENIWLTFTMGLSASRATLLGYEPSSFLLAGEMALISGETLPKRSSWHYREAWRVLGDKMRETRQKAVEGVEAIRKEVQMCAAAVGPPGLIPLQYMLDRLMPFSVEAGLKEHLETALSEIPSVTLSRFSVGATPPKLEAARIYDVGPSAMAFDCDTTWESELEATIQVHTGLAPRVPVTLKNVRFRGTVRVVLAPLTKSSPCGFGATLVSFLSMPEIGLDVAVAGGEVTKVLPGLRAEIIAGIQRSIADSMIWPKRVVIPSWDLHNDTVLSPQQLKELKSSDPLLQAEEALGSRPMLRSKLNHMSDLFHQNVASEKKAIVKVPMPSFALDQKASRRPTRVGTTGSPGVDTDKVQNGVFWDHFQKAQASVLEKQGSELPKLQHKLGRLLENSASSWKDLQRKLQPYTKHLMERLPTKDKNDLKIQNVFSFREGYLPSANCTL